MASAISKQWAKQSASIRLTNTNTLLSPKRKKSTLPKIKMLGADSFANRSSRDVIKRVVTQVTSILLGPQQMSGFNFSGGTSFTLSASGAMQFGSPTQSTIFSYEATQEQISKGVAAAGGMDAISPWLVDGKTKLNIDGGYRVVQIGAGGMESKPATLEEARTQAQNSLAMFGLSSSSLNGPLEQVRADLRTAAANITASEMTAGKNNASAIEYALEDAFAKLAAYESFKMGEPQSTEKYEQQLATNQDQANSIKNQLKLGADDTWGVDSLAQDLAVFGLDFTAFKNDPAELEQTINSKKEEMLADLDRRFTGTETSYYQEKNRITGAASRLTNGISGAAIIAKASASSSVSVNVSVGGTRVDAGFIIGVGNVVKDPLVLDLNGDGIDLSSADEGVDFDMDGTGQKTRTGFIRGDDALLFLDEHGDGIVRDGKQLFGNNDGYANGLEKLRQYDENGDGVIDENDSIYDKLMVWQEKTEDGVCERDETMTLREAGIASINLGYQNVREDDGKGNLIGQTGSFTRDDGTDGYAADVWLQTKPGAVTSGQG